ncbi:glycerol-3-phosphate dehydrogenase [Massospora cicadina]|nr:glycerol-3-phosphate dehydrogenase [Massospora cicadina]
MWVFEELVDGRKLTEIINSEHENVKYLPGVKLPENVKAVPELVEAAKDASILVFVSPHQFISKICETLKGKVCSDCARPFSLLKGVRFDNKEITLISDFISQELSIRVCTLSGANIANEIAREEFSETTIGFKEASDGKLFRQLFHTPYFRVNTVQDVHGVELCGALKNIVAIGAGFVDGLGLGSNTKAAIIRIGLMEMKRFAETFLEGVSDQTFFDSCGVGDVMTTCYGGRNRKVAEAFAKTGRPFDELEKEMLNGQKLQGTITATEVHQFLSARGRTSEFPLFERVYKICYEGLPVRNIISEY